MWELFIDEEYPEWWQWQHAIIAEVTWVGNEPILPIKQDQFEAIFNKKVGGRIQFHSPKTDQCQTCIELEQAVADAKSDNDMDTYN